MHQDSAPDAIDLASDIQLLIAEHDDSSLSDEQFRSAVASLVQPNEFQVKIEVLVLPNVPHPSLNVSVRDEMAVFMTGVAHQPWETTIPVPLAA